MNFITKIYFVDFIFQVQEDIRSLPPFHGARWNGFFRNLCNYMHISIEKAILGIIPFRYQQRTIKKDELIKVRILATEYFLENLAEIINKFDFIEFAGDFNPQNHNIYCIVDGITNKYINTSAEIKPQFLHFASIYLENEIMCLLEKNAWTIRFYSPLRLKSEKNDAIYKAEQTFCSKSFFQQYDYAATHLLKSIRFCSDTYSDVYFSITGNSLHWEDLRYSCKRQIILGGLIGSLKCQGELTRKTAELLVIGQYLGCGKNPRFGFGWWKIPELDLIRTINLPAI